MNRRERLVRVLADWEHLQGPAGGNGGPAEGEGVPQQAHSPRCSIYWALRCNCWLASLEELGNALGVLSEALPGPYLHLASRFGRQRLVRRRNLRVKGGAWQGLEAWQQVVIPDLPPSRSRMPDRVYAEVLVASWPEWVDQGLVSDALDWLERELPPDCPQLPGESFSPLVAVG